MNFAFTAAETAKIVANFGREFSEKLLRDLEFYAEKWSLEVRLDVFAQLHRELHKPPLRLAERRFYCALGSVYVAWVYTADSVWYDGAK